MDTRCNTLVIDGLNGKYRACRKKPVVELHGLTFCAYHAKRMYGEKYVDAQVAQQSKPVGIKGCSR